MQLNKHVSQNSIVAIPTGTRWAVHEPNLGGTKFKAHLQTGPGVRGGAVG
jgi:hypothetical protein